MTRGRILVVDDDRAMCTVLDDALRHEGFDVRTSNSPREALELLMLEDVEVLVTDLRMREMGGLEVCAQALRLRPGLPVVVMTAFGSLDTAVGAIRAGAYDFLTKPFDVEVAGLVLDRAVQFGRLRASLLELSEEVSRARGFSELMGRSRPMRELHDLLERVRDSEVSVLITGESGTGKELVARALHRQGPRRAGPFVPINCAALPEALLESELFGHARGAFTDAKTARPGLFVRASGGTLFLDEVGEMPVGVQAKLLRALQDRRIRPVGSDEEVPFDARILAATNQDLSASLESGAFREDLYFRLNVLELRVPPLRARGKDVLTLAQHFLERGAEEAGKRVTGLSPPVAAKLLDYPWPGNVRELQNCIERAIALARLEVITEDDLPERVRGYVSPKGVEPVERVSLEEIERRHVMRVLESVGGQRAAAAEILGIDRKTLYRKLGRWG